MFRLTAPSEDEVRHFISEQRLSDFSYPNVGASLTAGPAGYNVDHNRVQLGLWWLSVKWRSDVLR